MNLPPFLSPHPALLVLRWLQARLKKKCQWDEWAMGKVSSRERRRQELLQAFAALLCGQGSLLGAGHATLEDASAAFQNLADQLERLPDQVRGLLDQSEEFQELLRCGPSDSKHLSRALLLFQCHALAHHWSPLPLTLFPLVVGLGGLDGVWCGLPAALTLTRKEALALAKQWAESSECREAAREILAQRLSAVAQAERPGQPPPGSLFQHYQQFLADKRAGRLGPEALALWAADGSPPDFTTWLDKVRAAAAVPGCGPLWQLCGEACSVWLARWWTRGASSSARARRRQSSSGRQRC